MKIYILIMWLALPKWGTPVFDGSLQMQEFNSRAACLVALHTVRNVSERRINGRCVPK